MTTIHKPSFLQSVPVIISIITLVVMLLGLGVRNLLVLNSFMVRTETSYLTKTEAGDIYLRSDVYDANHKALAEIMAIQLQANTRELAELSGLITNHVSEGKTK